MCVDGLGGQGRWNCEVWFVSYHIVRRVNRCMMYLVRLGEQGWREGLVMLFIVGGGRWEVGWSRWVGGGGNGGASGTSGKYL